MQIEIDFDVFKELTVRRASEQVTYNDVLRDLLGLKGRPSQEHLSALSGPIGAGYLAAGRLLPDGTELQVRYKGKDYQARIQSGRVVSAGGKFFKSLSAAASDVTNTNVNGLRFWRAKRPGDVTFTLVAALPQDAAVG